MRTSVILILIIISIITVSDNVVARHDIHISYCKSELTDHTFSGKLTYYKDDFFAAVKGWNGRDIQRLAAGERADVAYQYLLRHFRVTADGDRQMPIIVTATGEDGSTIWFEFKVRSADRIGTITVDHRALFKEFGNQMNLLLIKSSGREENFVMTSSKPMISMKR